MAAEIAQFATLIEPWMPAYGHQVTSFLAVRVDDGSWRLCHAKIVLWPDIDGAPREPFDIDRPSIWAGRDVQATDPDRIRSLLHGLARMSQTAA